MVRMKLIFETICGTQFAIQVGDFDTLQEIKEKVQQNLEIPISSQTLSFNGNILRDDLDLLDIMHGSVIHLHIAADAATANLPAVEKLRLQLEIAPSEVITIHTSAGETVRQLKEKIRRKEGTPVDQILITNEDEMELPDHKRLRDCAFSLNTGVTVEFLPEPPRKRSRLSTSSQPPLTPTSIAQAACTVDKLSVVLQYLGGRMTMEVRAANKVRELKMRLEMMNLQLPRNGAYSFIHHRTVLDEERSFTSQKVAHGDLIDIYAGHFS